MKILVTGANGYIGQGVVKTILDSGNEVIATDFSTQYVDERAKRIDCNVFDIDNPYEYFENPDRVKKLMVSTNTCGKKLAASGFKFHYSFEESFRDWFKDCNEEGLR